MAVNKSSETRIAQLRDQRWSEADARVVLEAVERSGEPVGAFARRHEIDAQRIYRWRSRLSADAIHDGEERAETLSFAPVVVTGLGRAPAVIVRVGELEVEVHEPQNVDPSWLAEMIAAMGRV
jgi:transposase-like protein